MITLPPQEVNTSITINLPDANPLQVEEFSPTEAMALASDAKLVQSARKYTAMHKLRRCESDLRTAKGRVHEYEQVLVDLQNEVKEAEKNIEVLESGMAGIQRLVVQAELNTPDVCDSADTGSAVSSYYAPNHRVSNFVLSQDLGSLTLWCFVSVSYVEVDDLHSPLYKYYHQEMYRHVLRMRMPYRPT
jgi:hypothetical protein